MYPTCLWMLNLKKTRGESLRCAKKVDLGDKFIFYLLTLFAHHVKLALCFPAAIGPSVTEACSDSWRC